MAKKPDIEIILSAKGMDDVRAAFASVRAESDSAGRSLKASSEGAEGGFESLKERISDALSGVRELISTIGRITLAAAIASAVGFAAALSKARASVRETAGDISNMALASESLGEDILDFGGFTLAVEKLGGDASQAAAMMKALRDTAYQAAQGNEEAADKLNKFGLAWDEIINRSTGEMLDPTNIMANMIDTYDSAQGRLDGLRASQNLFGDEAGLIFKKLLDAGRDDFFATIDQNERLRGLSEADVKAARDFTKAKAEEAAAIDGLSNAFFRGYTAYAEYASIDRADGFGALKGVAEDLGASFGRLVYELTPSLILLLDRAGTQLADIFEYLSTGSTDAEWLNNIAGGLETARETWSKFKADVQDGVASFQRIASEVEERLLPAIERVTPALESSFAYVQSSVIPAVDGLISGFERLSEFVTTQTIPLFGTTLSGAFGDVLDLIATGETDAPWLTSLTESIEEFVQDMAEVFSIINAVKDAFLGIADFITQTILPIFNIDVSSVGLIAGFVFFGAVLTKIIPIVKGAFGILVGIDRILGKVVGGILGFFGIGFGSSSGIVTSLSFIFVLFKDFFALTLAGFTAIATKIGLVGAASKVAAGAAGLAAGVGAGTAAAGAAGLAAVGATYVAVTSTQDLEEAMKAASDRTNELAETQGQEYAAAYYKAVLERIEKEAGAAGLISDFANLFGAGVDFELGISYSEETIRLGGAEAADAARDGFIQAFKDNGWEIDPDGNYNIGAGLTISGVELLDEVSGDLSAIEGQIEISEISGLEEQLNANLRALEAELDISKITGIEDQFNAGLEEAARAMSAEIAAFQPPAAAQLAAPAVAQAPAGGAQVIFQFGDGSQEVATISPASAITGLMSRRARGVI